MKTTITILTLCLFIFAGTQNSQAQTKEETIAWIKEALEKHGKTTYSYYANVQVSPCEISWVEVDVDVDDEWYMDIPSDYCVIDLNMGGSWKAGENGQHVAAESSIVKYFSFNTAIGEFEEKEFMKVKFFPIGSAENELAERMAKALNHLATFCESDE